MSLRLIPNVLLAVATAMVAAAPTFAAPTVELELATERGLQITAPHEWLQLLTAIGVDNVRIRGAQPGDAPKLDNRGSEAMPRYHVLGILTGDERLLLPGGTFGRADRSRLKSYFEQLAADGAEGVTATRGRFGLTEKQLRAAVADLSQSIDFETKGLSPRDLLERLQRKFSLQFAIDTRADQAMRAAKPVADEVRGLTAGTGLAIVLRGYGLVLRPEKSRGQAVAHHVAVADAALLNQSTLGRPDDPEKSPEYWPVGWEPEQPTRAVAPVLFEFLNAEIDGYTLEETLSAIGPRIKIPLFLDHRALSAHKIDPAAVEVSLARTRTYYMRVLDRVLSQARLGGQVRVDEEGTPFYWITR